MNPITFVSWRWRSPVGYRSTFDPETVYALREMIRRHFPHPHRFVCVCDFPKELKGVETIQLWDDGAAIPSPFGRHNPSCYRRLKIFAPDAGKVFGERIVSIDLDTVIVRDLTPLFDRDDDFVIWGESAEERKRWGEAPKQYYCGSMWMLKTGTRPQVWTQFDPDVTPGKVKRAGHFGSDQGVIAYILGPNEAMWGRKDGVYSWRKHIHPKGGKLPPEARVIFWHGKMDPWSYAGQQYAWVREHYPLNAPSGVNL